MLCSRAKRLMVDYIDGELSGRTRLSMEKHIDVCPECRKVHADIRSLNTLLSQVPEMEVPFGFSSRVLGKLRREEAVPSLLRWRPFRFLPVPVFAQATVATIILGVTFLGVYLGASFPSHKRVDKIFQTAGFGYISSGSVESNYFELVLTLHSSKKGR